MVNNKHVFWIAFVFTAIIFIIGLIFGFFLESYRSDKVEISLLYSEVNLLDEQIREQIPSNFNVSCQDIRDSTFNFADKIYGEALKLENYDSSSKFLDSLYILHKRYDILRMMLWSESIDVKKRCSYNFHTLVYLYEYNTEDIDTNSKQAFFSNLLIDLKNNHDKELLLIPIAANMDLESVNMVVKSYNITEYPVIIIDEQKIVKEVLTLNELEKEVFGK